MTTPCAHDDIALLKARDEFAPAQPKVKDAAAQPDPGAEGVTIEEMCTVINHLLFPYEAVPAGGIGGVQIRSTGVTARDREVMGAAVALLRESAAWQAEALLRTQNSDHWQGHRLEAALRDVDELAMACGCATCGLVHARICAVAVEIGL